ncbi:unnamed protein product [Adineta ricciae]|nr:unnamed protein product [Adineta ricciae]
MASTTAQTDNLHDPPQIMLQQSVCETTGSLQSMAQTAYTPTINNLLQEFSPNSPVNEFDLAVQHLIAETMETVSLLGDS